jgi:hypothetical protein
VAEACVAWACRHGIENDWSMRQLAEYGECATTTICRAKKALFSAGFIEEVRPSVFHASRHKENLAALFRFTERFYQIVFAARHRRAKRPSPQGSEGSKKPTCTKHQQAPSVPPAVPVRDDSPVVELLVNQAGLGVGGARVVAEHLAEVPPEVVPYLLEVTKEVVAKRKVEKTPEALLVGILRAKDPALLAEARKRHRRVSEWMARAAGSGAWDGLHLAYKARPGAREAFLRWLEAKAVVEAMRPDHPAYLGSHDLMREALAEVVSIARAAAGTVADQAEREIEASLLATGARPGSLTWARALNSQFNTWILGWAGLRSV